MGEVLIHVSMVFPVPGKWTIETRGDGEFVLTNETDHSASIKVDKCRVWEGDE